VTKREAPDPAITDFAHSVGLMVRRLRAAASSQELSWSETAALKCLAKNGPATTADLARAQGMRPQSMRTIVTALEESGLVERKPHPTDGRQVNLELTAKGATAQRNSAEAKQNWLVQAFSQLDQHDQDTLFAAGEIIKRMAQENQS
jgi:DNA-binding MarR family transcriptional regulator